MLGFANHLTAFHSRRQGLSAALARGLAAYLSSTPMDRHFRRFSGHTQVNATDLRSLPYPSKADLTALGEWVQTRSKVPQGELDENVEAIIA
jgi:adenine-specific DNA-methyltransferase